MSGTRFETLRDVSQTLLDLLRENLDDIDEDIALASPKNAGSNLLTLFLYKVTENPDLRNTDRRLSPRVDGRLTADRAPLTLDAYYLLTAHALGDPPNQLEAHRALSRAMRVFYDNGIIVGSLLRADDPTTGLSAESALRLSFMPVTMEDMTRIWSVFPDTPYELSVAYLVTPVVIESARDVIGPPVVDQVHDQGHFTPEPQGAKT
jgi:hypothetical protein